MQRTVKVAVSTALWCVLAGGVALSQPAAGPGMGHGMMGGVGPGMGGAFADPASYLDGLKTQLGISSTQQPAWNEYAGSLKAAATQMRVAHETMYDAMGTATWRERRDMMNRMFETRQQVWDTVHAAAQKLLPSLSAEQQAKASATLPGLRAGGRGMMSRMAPPTRSSP